MEGGGRAPWDLSLQMTHTEACGVGVACRAAAQKTVVVMTRGGEVPKNFPDTLCHLRQRYLRCEALYDTMVTVVGWKGLSLLAARTAQEGVPFVGMLRSGSRVLLSG